MSASSVERGKSPLAVYIEIARPVNGLIAAMGVAIGAQLGVRGRGVGWTSVDGWCTLAVALATGLILSAGNALNDAYDVEIDRINRPERPIPSGRLTVGQARIFAVACMALGVILAVLVGRDEVLIAGGASACLIAYAVALKGVPLGGNLVVAALTAAAFFAGGIAVNGARYTLAPLVFVFVFTVTREIVKDVEDVVGDAQHGARTVAVVWGRSTALWIATIFAVAGVLFSPLPYLLGWDGFGWRYLATVLVGVDGVILWAIWRVWRSPGAESARLAQRWIKLGSVVGLIAVYIG